MSSLSLFYRYYFDSSLSELVELVPRLYSLGKSTRYSERLQCMVFVSPFLDVTTMFAGPPKQLSKKGGLMKKRAVSNLLVLAGGITTVCTGEKFLKIRVPRLTKIGFLTHFFVICCPTKPTFLYEHSQNNCFEMHHRCIYKNTVRSHP